MHTQLTLKQARQFILAGNATFTIKSKRTGKHFTYKVKQAKKGVKPPYFVMLMTGPDNNHHFSYFATIFVTQYRYGRKAKLSRSSLGVRAFEWFWKKLIANVDIRHEVEFYHEGRCCRCGRKLTHPKSVETGIGPECAGRTKTNQLSLVDVE